MTKAIMGKGLLIRPYHESDESQVMSLLGQTLGDGPAGRRPAEFFRWKHLQNPHGPSLMIVADFRGQIVGLRAFLRWRFRAGGHEIRAVRAVDTATHPEHQGKGIFSRLTLEALELLQGETDLIFNTPNLSSLPGYLKMGWRTVGTVPVWVRVRRPLRFGLGVRTIGTDSAPVTERPSPAARSAKQVLSSAIDIAALLESRSFGEKRLTTVIDEGYLRWRYADAPLLDYRSVVEVREGQLSGIAFFRVRPRGSLWESTVADVIVRPGDRRTAGHLIARIAHAARVDHVTCHFPAGSAELGAARHKGFLRSPRGETLVVNTLSDGIPVDPTAPDSWAVSLGTLEVF